MPTNAVAMVGAQPIMAEALQGELARRARSAPGKYHDPQARRAVLDELIRFEVLHQRALAAGYGEDPQIAATLKRMIVAKYQEDQLAQPGAPPVTADDLAAYYRRHPERFGAPEKARASIIELKIARSAPAEKRAELAQKAETIRAEARTNSAGLKLGLLAQRYSEHQPSRYRGGDIGWIHAGQTNADWPAAVVDAMFTLTQPGEFSPVVQTPTAFYLIELLEKQPAQMRPLAEVRDGIAYLVTREKERQREEEFAARMKEGLPIRINQPLIDSITVTGDHPGPPAVPGGGSGVNGRMGQTFPGVHAR